MSKEELELTRRGLLQTAGVATATLGLATLGLTADSSGRLEFAVPPAEGQSMMGVPFAKHTKVRIAMIGTGGRGSSLLGNLLALENVEIVALCDKIESRVRGAAKHVTNAGHKEPALYFGSDTAFEKLNARDDIDIVYIATPWIWHVQMAVHAMEQGKHVACEVPAARTLEDCWKLVNTSEKTRKHCIMLENCCYGYNEMLMLGVVRAGLLGVITQGGAAYNHDLREILFEAQGEGEWRRAEHLHRNGNLYPTHGLGPVANYMGIHRGDKFDYLVSMSSPEAGLTEYRKKHLAKDDPRMNETYACGDQNTSLIKTHTGKMIRLEHNVSSPEPYSRINMIAGSNGIFVDYPARIYIEGRQKDDEYVNLDSYKAEFEHDLWRRIGELARKSGGHGGMDFIMNYRVVQCMLDGTAPDSDVYDAAAWSAPSAVSEASVKRGSAPVKFPDFTRGKWKEARPMGI